MIEKDKIFNSLKKGQPFHFIHKGDELFIGVACGYDDKIEEHLFWHCKVIDNEGKLTKIIRNSDGIGSEVNEVRGSK